MRRKCKDKEKSRESREQQKCEIAIGFARMYGIKETLEPLEFMENEAVIEMILRWTDEFIESHSWDMVQFFERKSECLGKKRP